MAFCRIFFVISVTLSCVTASQSHEKRETKSHLCDPVYNNTNKIQCYCNHDNRAQDLIRSAECYPTVEGIAPDDDNWNAFYELENTQKLVFTNTRGIVLKYIPKQALTYTKSLMKLEIKYATIDKIESFNFANLTFLEIMTLRDNQIKVLKNNAFAHHRDLTSLILDSNSIVEINRNVFVDLPSLEKLYLTRNKITTIHDRAFVHLANLRELEIDRNNLFSLNSETFSGLKKLEKLDLSSNSLEVIGDNTFVPLQNLQILNLDGNKIQMLDEKAFYGLSKLQGLSLAYNALKEIKNEKIFIGLKSLKMLNLKGNQIRHLEEVVMEPLLQNLYGNTSSLDVEDNLFPCDCRLDWFISLMNYTKSSHMKLAIENLKCIPSADVKEKWSKVLEADKNSQEQEEDAPNDYEYYDDTLLNGKLFYIDMRFLLNCTANFGDLLKSDVDAKPKASKDSVTSEPITYKPKTEDIKKDIITSTVKSVAIGSTNVDGKTNIYTTSRLSTVSAKPIGKEYFDDRGMASDEGKPDRIKAHRSIQDDVSEKSDSFSSGTNTIASVYVPAVVIGIKLLL